MLGLGVGSCSKHVAAPAAAAKQLLSSPNVTEKPVVRTTETNNLSIDLDLN